MTAAIGGWDIETIEEQARRDNVPLLEALERKLTRENENWWRLYGRGGTQTAHPALSENNTRPSRIQGRAVTP